MTGRPPTSPLFPYTTLFRSGGRPGEQVDHAAGEVGGGQHLDRKSTRLNSSHMSISYAVFGLKKNSNVERLITSGRTDELPASADSYVRGRPSTCYDVCATHI